MLAGPLVTRELTTDPRKPKHFGIRAGYAAALTVLVFTGAQATFALAPPRGLGDLSRFSVFIFNLLSFVQLVVVLGTSLLFTAGSVAQEKDRRTLILLLMTDLKTSELVIGKAIASLLPTFIMILVSIPVFTVLTQLGGVTLEQVIWFEALCFVTALAAGSWGTLVAYWKEKTFQIIAITLMGAGIFLGGIEAIALLGGENSTLTLIAGSLNPFRALSDILSPLASHPDSTSPVIQAWPAVVGLLVLSAGISSLTCLYVRIWNPPRTIFVKAEETSALEKDLEKAGTEQVSADKEPSHVRDSRTIWETPIIWREICTQAYGKKVGLIKGAYFAFAVACVFWLRQLPAETTYMLGIISASGLAFTVLSLISFILINAQAVTSLTSERDGQTLELLLVTEVTAKEFIFGKLGGVLFNMKEVILVPFLFVGMSWMRGEMNLESLIFVIIGHLTLVLFAAALGLHSGLSFENSRSAILNSLGTIFFLFIGIFVCMILIVEARSSFEMQFVPFIAFIGGGSLGLWMSLTHKNPSSALSLCGVILPFMTFYAIVSFLLGNTAAVLMAVLFPFGFTVTAILVPAVSAFDVALGRTTTDRG